MHPALRHLGQWAHPYARFRGPEAGPTCYLTFDDGPTPGVTDWVLEALAHADARATFFCLGRQAAAHTALVRALQQAGHAVGHHSYSHPDGWCTPWRAYWADCQRGKTVVEDALGAATCGFRPPYGHLPLGHGAALRGLGPVWLWDVLTHDYRPDFRLADQLPRILGATGPGSILVCHDSHTAEAQLRQLLPPLLAELSARGYRFATL